MPIRGIQLVNVYGIILVLYISYTATKFRQRIKDTMVNIKSGEDEKIQKMIWKLKTGVVQHKDRW